MKAKEGPPWFCTCCCLLNFDGGLITSLVNIIENILDGSNIVAPLNVDVTIKSLYEILPVRNNVGIGKGVRLVTPVGFKKLPPSVGDLRRYESATPKYNSACIAS